MKSTLKTLGIAVLGGGIVLGAQSLIEHQYPEKTDTTYTSPIPILRTSATPLTGASFTESAETAVLSVVHVKTSVEQGYYYNPLHEFFYGDKKSVTPRIVQGSGSGVIISDQGFIVTNNHVIDNAQEIKVSTNDNREFTAELIGTDPTTDIAVLKIDADELHALPFGNSDDLKLGEWVLAVGNPFNLTGTVTAGIISAKGRNINIIDNQSAIEAFIQTDAVVNPGNSGGALVNTNGELIGINTAISTHTGSFEGYSFAVPSNIVQKVVDDIIRFGMVQRAYLGVSITDVTPQLLNELELKETKGIYLSGIVEGGAAADAGLKEGDIITSIAGKNVVKTSELLEIIGRKRPGDRVDVVLNRDGNIITKTLTLRNRQGNTKLLTSDDLASSKTLGAQFRSLSTEDKRKLGLRNGIVIADVQPGKFKELGIPKGFIIVKMNQTVVDDPKVAEKMLAKLNPGEKIMIQGYHPDGKPDYFVVGL